MIKQLRLQKVIVYIVHYCQYLPFQCNNYDEFMMMKMTRVIVKHFKMAMTQNVLFYLYPQRKCSAGKAAQTTRL